MRKDTTHSGWSLEDRLELPHALVGAVHAERALNFSRCAVGGRTKSTISTTPTQRAPAHRSPSRTNHCRRRRRTTLVTKGHDKKEKKEG